MTDTLLVRLKPYDPRRGHVLRRYTYAGIKFQEERGWYRVERPVAEYLRAVREVPSDRYAPLAFDVCTEAEANPGPAQRELMAALKPPQERHPMNDAYAMAQVAWQEQAARQTREIADLRARLAAAEKLNEEARANGLADMIAQRNAALKKLAAAETRASMARLDDSQRDELAACKLALAVAEKERDEARALAAKMEKARDLFKADADREWGASATERANLTTRAERAEALAAMRGEALRECLQRIEYRPTGEDPLIVIKARAALSGDTGEWLAAERRRVAEAVREACWKAQTGRGIESQPGWFTHDLRHLDLSALLSAMKEKMS